MNADATGDRGYIWLGVIASQTMTDIHVGEVVDGRFAELGQPQLAPLAAGPAFAGDGTWTAPRAATWSCDRLTRDFEAYGTNDQGIVETSVFSVRTPSCSTRLDLSAPVRADRGQPVTITATDTFTLGGVAARGCVRPPDRALICRDIAVNPTVSQTFTPRRKGRWRVVVRTPEQTLRRVVSVGVAPRPADLAALPVVMPVGDSLMQGLDAVLEDRLADRARVESDVHPGAGLTTSTVVDWPALARADVERDHPQLTVVLLGVNDGYALGGVECCGAVWRARYARRARGVMRIYTSGGGSVLWLTIPVLGDPARERVAKAVNAALATAAAGLPRAYLGDLRGPVGTDQALRQPDAVHLNTAGAEVAADAVLAEALRDGFSWAMQERGRSPFLH